MFILFSTFFFYSRSYQDFSLHFNERKVQLNAQLNKIQWDVDRIQLFAMWCRRCSVMLLFFVFIFMQWNSNSTSTTSITTTKIRLKWIFSMCRCTHRCMAIRSCTICAMNFCWTEIELSARISIDSNWIESNRSRDSECSFTKLYLQIE